MTQYNAGDMVYAVDNLYNDPIEETGESAIPGVFPGMLLVPAGTRGMVVNVGHPEAMPEETLYLVSFETGKNGALAEPVGCLGEEISYRNPASP